MKKGKTILPRDVKQLKLSQLIAVANYAHINDIEELKNKSLFYESLAAFRQTDMLEAMKLTTDSIKETLKAISVCYKSIANYYVSAIEDKGLNLSFSCKNSKEYERVNFYTEYNNSNIFQKIKLRKEKKELNKVLTFDVQKNITLLPTAIWEFLLDSTVSSIKKSKSPHEEWLHIPFVVACLAWNKQNDMFTKDLEGKTIVNINRIYEKKDIFLQIDATIAIQIFAFFLRKRIGFSKNHVLSRYSEGVKTTKPFPKEKDIQRGGDGGHTSEM